MNLPHSPLKIDTVCLCNHFGALQNAHWVLGIPPTLCDTITLSQAKRYYHKGALKLHPDKNTTFDTSTEFVSLANAYELTCSYITSGRTRTTSEQDDEQDDEQDSAEDDADDNHMNVVPREYIHRFINVLCRGQSETIKQMAHAFTSNIPEISHTLVELLVRTSNRVKCIELYDLLYKYQWTLGIRTSTIEMVHRAIQQKYSMVKRIFDVTPNIDQLFQRRVYSLVVTDPDTLATKTLAVPLWNTEMIFDDVIPGQELIVRCNPILPPNVTHIDERNHIYCNVYLTFAPQPPQAQKDQPHDHSAPQPAPHSIYTPFNEIQEWIPVSIGAQTFQIPLKELYIRPSQTYVFKRRGIPTINENDPFDVCELSDIVVTIYIT